MMLVRWFCVSSSLILCFTGIAKILSAFGHVQVLAVPDPIFGLQFNHLMLLVGTIELAVAWVCFSKRQAHFSVIIVAWLATSMLFYRYGLWMMGWRRPCSCLGNFTDAIHISPHAADNSMKVALGYLLIGSYAALIWFARRRGAATSIRE